jgi:3-oxoacid CoA-transferase subunit B
MHALADALIGATTAKIAGHGGVDLKILSECNLPLTGVAVVDLIITDLGVLEVGDNGLTLRELAPGITVETLKANTGCPIDTTGFESGASR